MSLLHLPHRGLSFRRSPGIRFTAPQYGHTTFRERLIFHPYHDSDFIRKHILNIPNKGRDWRTVNQALLAHVGITPVIGTKECAIAVNMIEIHVWCIFFKYRVPENNAA